MDIANCLDDLRALSIRSAAARGGRRPRSSSKRDPAGQGSSFASDRALADRGGASDVYRAYYLELVQPAV
jgi:hypothetical protein